MDQIDYSKKVLRVQIRKGKFAKFLDLVPLIAVSVAVFAIWYAVDNVNKTLNLQSETQAIELFNQYALRVERNVKFNDTSFTHNPRNWTDQYALYAHYVLFVSESIYNLRQGVPSWENTLREYMLSPHVRFYEANASVDSSLSPEFLRFYGEVKKYVLASESAKSRRAIGK